MLGNKLTSRKFLLSLAVIMAALAHGETLVAALAAGVYVLVEGVNDARRS